MLATALIATINAPPFYGFADTLGAVLRYFQKLD